VRVTAGQDGWDGDAGDYLVLPLTRHDLTALEDSVVLLTVVAGSRG
jgi:quercetin dioxygenase-like cupin family protein